MLCDTADKATSSTPHKIVLDTLTANSHKYIFRKNIDLYTRPN